MKGYTLVVDLGDWCVRHDDLSYELCRWVKRKKGDVIRDGEPGVFQAVSWHRTLTLALRSHLARNAPMHAHTRSYALSLIDAERELVDEMVAAVQEAVKGTNHG